MRSSRTTHLSRTYTFALEMYTSLLITKPVLERLRVSVGETDSQYIAAVAIRRKIKNKKPEELLEIILEGDRDISRGECVKLSEVFVKYNETATNRYVGLELQQGPLSMLRQIAYLQILAYFIYFSRRY